MRSVAPYSPNALCFVLNILKVIIFELICLLVGLNMLFLYYALSFYSFLSKIKSLRLIQILR